ncbi:MAG: MBL fold metallo-hydrolase [Pyrobaculum sp.]|uniref:Beta-lactamase domain protein n=2 Tax=Pyrobaculum arsenaticum TaxID=121277 RepID=A4WLL2_PYRAR|nr:MBL fold metallo-hydrolase [Pyrobaculum arsenaticum]ABP51279.1 beta-lactamase domain protein [Pyrobaculum arsenaticum DSM 13514]MCY0889495.1 MBL fold metallo-hydrolase [Pyrobaculum arsenaticum]NYR16351.1 MBL fold metallo-hydrolase [Pyrobaculum arsenaticum]
MRIKLLGGAGEVGRLAVLIKTASSGLLLDYGVSFDAQDRPVFPLHVRPKDLSAVFLSHAHLDHSGALPFLYISTRTPLYSTPLTMELSDLMYTDAIKLSGYYLPYTLEEVKETMSSAIPLTYGEPVDVGNGISLTAYNAGHIPGSALAVIEVEGRVVVFTGDFNTVDTNLLRGADVYNLPKNPDVVIMEATYASANHPPRDKLEKEFVQSVKEVLEGGGSVLIPSFALGRAQEILLTLVKHGVEYPIYVDGLARQINQIVGRYPHLLKDPSLYKKALDVSIEVPNTYVRKGAAEEPSVIIAPAGMIKGGAALFYFKKMAGNRKNGVFLPSFQAPNTPGFQILSKGYAIVDGAVIKVEARLEWFDFSAHAGRGELEAFIKRFSPETKIILVHTDPATAAPLVKKLAEDGYDNIYLPTTPGEELALQ